VIKCFIPCKTIENGPQNFNKFSPVILCAEPFGLFTMYIWVKNNFSQWGFKKKYGPQLALMVEIPRVAGAAIIGDLPLEMSAGSLMAWVTTVVVKLSCPKKTHVFQQLLCLVDVFTACSRINIHMDGDFFMSST
jgi:hypothetical protein